ncbi:MAG: glycosyltransferase family 39 protein [Actinobacteria bacterium]|nr:glycosyltransferase family 39 protein [Actinomycetota bacterium]
MSISSFFHRAARPPVTIFLLTRGGLFFFVPVAFFIILRAIPGLGISPPLHYVPLANVSGWGHYFFAPWARWDTGWYLKIARRGYLPQDGSVAFFPLYPFLIASLRLLFAGNRLMTAIFISLTACLAAFYLLFRLVELDFSTGAARKSVLFLAVFPTSFFLQAVYTESLFLALTVGSFYAARRRRYFLAGVAAGLAALTRNTGVLLLMPLIIFYMSDRSWNWRRIDMNILSLLLAPAGLLGWMFILKINFGQALLFATAQAQWGRHLAGPLAGGPLAALANGFLDAFRGAGAVVSNPVHSLWPPNTFDPAYLGSAALIDFGLTVSFVVLTALAFRRLPLAYAVYGLLVLLVPLLYPHSPAFPSADFRQPLLSMPRFLLADFPAFILFGIGVAKKPRLSMAAASVSVLLLMALTARFILGEWVA